MRIVYRQHSGFSIETDEMVMLIDYVGGGFVRDHRPVIALVSHAHGDHRRPDMISFAEHIVDCPAVGEEMIALGSPSGQLNAITLGKVLKYSVITIVSADAEKSNVLFPVIWHTAPMDNGSSGGVIVNHELEIIGVNYAAASKNGEFVNGLAVPVTKVLEFLDKYGITVHKA